jgi:hypothetical protein
MCFGFIKSTDFANLSVTLSSSKHAITQNTLSGSWTAKDFRFISDSLGSDSKDELFKVIARQKIIDLEKE